MLTMVEVINDQGDNLALPIEGVTDGFIVESIQGLDPVKASVSSSPLAQMSGERHQASRRGIRNIVMKINLDPDYVVTTVQDLRNLLYSYFMPASDVELQFYLNGVKTAYILGHVESFDTPLFAKESQVTISILCFDPDFLAIESTTIVQTIEKQGEVSINYLGTVPTGLRMELSFAPGGPGFTITNQVANGSRQTFEFSGAIGFAQMIEVDTSPGGKKAILHTSGVASSMLYGVSPESRWPRIL